MIAHSVQRVTQSNSPRREFRGWVTSLMVEAVELSGQRVNVVTGVIATTGGLQIAMRVGDGTTIVLSPGAAAQLVVNLRKSVGTKMQAER
jgi:hypothetical protein